jgi:hypothetical protein
MTAAASPQRQPKLVSLWRPGRYLLAAAAGILVIVMAFVVHHRPSFVFDDPSRTGCTSCGFPEDLPSISLAEAELPAGQFLDALLDENWLKVERYLAPATDDREYLDNFKLYPIVEQLTSSDCSSKDIQSLTVSPPVQDSLVFFATAQMKRLCTSPDGRTFNRMLYQVYPVAEEWYYVANTLRLETPRAQ